MGQTSAGAAWPPRIHAGAWDDCYDEPCKPKVCNRHLWPGLWPVYRRTPRTQGMTMPPCKTQVTLRSLKGTQDGCTMEKGDASQREEGLGKETTPPSLRL